MKPTCPASCLLKQRMDQNKRDMAQKEELHTILEQLSPARRRQFLAFATFLYYQEKGFTRLSTWREMAERQRVLYFVWGFFEKLDFAMIKGKW